MRSFSIQIASAIFVSFTLIAGFLIAPSAGYADGIDTAPGTTSLPINVEGNNVMTLLSSGNVGIGTTSPANALDVAGGANIGSGSANYLDIAGGTSGNPVTISAKTTGACCSPVGLTFASGVNGNIEFVGGASGNTELLRVSMPGQVVVEPGNTNSGVSVIGLSTSGLGPVGWGGGSSGWTISAYGDNYIASSFDDDLAVGWASGGIGTTALTLTKAGNLGIGTTNPSTPLDLSGSSGADATRLRVVNTTSRTWDMAVMGSGVGWGPGDFGIGDITASSWRLVIDPSGNVGIGTVTPSYQLQVNSTYGGLGVFTSGAGIYALYGNASGPGSWGLFCGVGFCGGNMAWINNSDRRLKTDIHPIENALDKVLKLQGVYYHWRDPKKNASEGEKVGLIAQDVEAVFPQVVKTDRMAKDALPGGTKMLSYSELIAPVIEAIKELYGKWQADHETLQAQTNEIKTLQDEVTELRHEIQTKRTHE